MKFEIETTTFLFIREEELKLAEKLTRRAFPAEIQESIETGQVVLNGWTRYYLQIAAPITGTAMAIFVKRLNQI